MVLRQENQSFQNDGNFSMLDLRDTSPDGKRMRLESFRASQPDKLSHHVTAAGTSAFNLCGADHLVLGSNQIFRHIFSTEDTQKKEMVVSLELREKYQEDGSWEVKVRDLQFGSASFGCVLVCTAVPLRGRQEGTYLLTYELYRPRFDKSYLVTSPLTLSISTVDADLPDLSERNGRQGILQIEHRIHVTRNLSARALEQKFEPLMHILKETAFSTFVGNVLRLIAFSNFQGKATHTGEFLTGDNVPEVAHHLGHFTSCGVMILMGKVFQLTHYGMSDPAFSLLEVDAPLKFRNHIGMYETYILAHTINVELYQLVLDKLYSDYGEVPMKPQRGSQLENGKKAFRNAYLANKTLADIAVSYYETHINDKLR